MLHKTKGRLAAVFFRFVEHARLRRAAPLTPAAPRLPPGARGKGFPRRALRAPFGRPPASESVLACRQVYQHLPPAVTLSVFADEVFFLGQTDRH